ncbi:hypothetical protein HCN44_009282 [Aphidius gifuensis]|uniref:Dihydrolipoamide acetyltransferase component of pyruvate dehydrogenase complex n=1 Tax=Aphidius gifuensis TaxID=684658 RepID=A0A834Y607_APHGI|nr:lipoamide acyltransferase component of branched-chain alpha-keto acid dehydrogenase complex, mitochondrial [Aphidius gifuensis]KAF7997884.1 hypothetical protein HCN44_009282 [Aphidius gifuensis]
MKRTAMALAWRLSSIVKLRTAVGLRTRLFSLSYVKHGTVVPFKLSDIGEGIREVTVKEWFVKPGDKVSQFDQICEVQSDKASVTITSRYDGSIKNLHYQIDDVALVGNPLVDIELDSVIKDTVVESTEPIKKITSSTSSKQTENNTDEHVYEKTITTPAVRRIAAENFIDLKKIIPTGKAGRVLKEDIISYLENKKLSVNNDKKNKQLNNDEFEIITLKGYEKHMWKSMTKSISIPHFSYSDEIEVTKLIEFRNNVKDILKKEENISLSFLPFIIKALSKALEKYPRLNAWLDEDSQSLKIFKNHNVSIAMDTPNGLVVPNIKNVQNQSIVEISRELNRIQLLGEKSSFSIDDLSGGTISLSNIGIIGGTYTKPVIASPQIAIGAIGKIQKLPRFDDQGNLITANILTITWSADHRVLDGVTVAKFSNVMRHYMENPSHLLIL